MTVVRSIGGVFCDDIRQEVSGKFTLVGCYNSQMLVREFPAYLPQLCVLVRIITPADQPFKEVKVRILQENLELANVDIPAREYQSEGPVVPEEGAMHELHAQFILGPLTVEKPETFRVRALLDGVEVRGLALAVDKMSSDVPAKSKSAKRSLKASRSG